MVSARNLMRVMAVAMALAFVGSSALVVAAGQKPRMRIGGDVKEPKKLKDVAPVYPEDAKSAGVQGVVIIEAVIGTDGKIVEARVLRPVPLLDKAAIDAVQQWEYTPTLLNGEPIEVIMTVTVNFQLK